MACHAALLRGGTLNLACPAVDWLLTLESAQSRLFHPTRVFRANGIVPLPTEPFRLFRSDGMKSQSGRQALELRDAVGASWRGGVWANSQPD
jgi:hypothetical protein